MADRVNAQSAFVVQAPVGLRVAAQSAFVVLAYVPPPPPVGPGRRRQSQLQ